MKTLKVANGVFCPNDMSHKRFMGRAQVEQTWEIDANGEVVEVLDDLRSVRKIPADSDILCLECRGKPVRARVFEIGEAGYVVEFKESSGKKRIMDYLEALRILEAAGVSDDSQDHVLDMVGYTLEVHTPREEFTMTRIF